jgi:hypothetical protein
MTWTAKAIGGGPPLQYKFVLVRKATNTTTTVQDGPSNVLVWTPQFSGNYTLQVLIRSTIHKRRTRHWPAPVCSL